VPHELKKKIIMPTDKTKEERFMMVADFTWCATSGTKRGVIANALEKNDAIFDYVPTIITKNPSLGTKYLNSSTDYQNFKQFLKTPKYSFETETEIALKTLWLWPKRKVRQYLNTNLLAALQKAESSTT
jgi:carboxyl-terminal processing protease